MGISMLQDVIALMKKEVLK